MFGPHLVEIRSETKSSDKGHISDYIWSKSAAWQSPPTRGTIWTTFGRSPLRDKVLQQGAQFGTHLVKVCSETKSSDKWHHFFATFGQCPLRDKFLWWPIMGIISGHIWSKSPVGHVLRRGAFFLFMPNLANTSCSTLISHCSFFWMPVALASQPTLPTWPLFPRGPISRELPTKFSS